MKKFVLGFAMFLALVIFVGSNTVYAETGSVGSPQAITENLPSIYYIKPVSFFEKIGLFFTFNQEKRANIFQDFSNRNFELAKEKIETGKLDEASVLFQKSDDDIKKAVESISKIKNEDTQKTILNTLAATTLNRTTVLTAVQAKVENPIAKEAIGRAIEKQLETKSFVDEDVQSLLSKITELETKIKDLENKSITTEQQKIEKEIKLPIADDTVNNEKKNAEKKVTDTGTGTNKSLCNITTAPSIKVIDQNGGEFFDVNENIPNLSLKISWQMCNIPMSRAKVELRQGSHSYLFNSVHNMVLDTPAALPNSYANLDEIDNASSVLTSLGMISGGGYKIVVTDSLNPNYTDSSDGSFSIRIDNTVK